MAAVLVGISAAVGRQRIGRRGLPDAAAADLVAT
jgi:hypothetical protein